MIGEMSGGEVIDTVSKACAYGDFERAKRFIEDDPSCVNKPDEQGYFPLQWAALNNRVSEATYLLSHGASVNGKDRTGQTALHWAAVRGSLPVIEILLRNNADFEQRDERGYTICHVAAQYGQAAVLYFLALKWNVEVDSADQDGRTPLHWAAYKGYVDCVRLLLVLDARYTSPDKEGCTPLHWAAIKGNPEACTVLLQGGATSCLEQQDVTGSTPSQLAIEKGHRYLGLYLADYRKKHEKGPWGRGGRCSWLTSTQLCPVIWVLIIALVTLFIYKVVGGRSPVHSTAMLGLSWSCAISAGVGLILLYLTTTSDPGFISSNTSSSTKAQYTAAGVSVKSLDSPALWAGNWQQLCVTCRIVRPLRSKHCAVTGRCIEVFDHYCPWVGNAIGKGNRHYFLAFLWIELWAMICGAIVGLVQICDQLGGQYTSDLAWVFVFEAVDIFVGISVAALAIAQASQVVRNVTTNELANWHKYRYLQGPTGHFTNPFSTGVLSNCSEVCNPGAVPIAPVFVGKDGRLPSSKDFAV
jgi:palmitoyltransferase ZDHHC13/17